MSEFVPRPYQIVVTEDGQILVSDTPRNIVDICKQDGYDEDEVRLMAKVFDEERGLDGVKTTPPLNFTDAEVIYALSKIHGHPVIIDFDPNKEARERIKGLIKDRDKILAQKENTVVSKSAEFGKSEEVTLPSERKNDHFGRNPGVVYRVAFYVNSKTPNNDGNLRFVKGTVTFVGEEDGARVVYFYGDSSWNTVDDVFNGRKGKANINDPEIMLEWEYDHFKEHPNYLKKWLMKVKADPEFKKALGKEAGLSWQEIDEILADPLTVA